MAPLSERKSSLAAHVKEKPHLGSTERESDFNENIYSPWAEMVDLSSND